ncbi:efflux RND transporter periplasmic adaptor subunit [Parabacteroides timonensis]|uniref:efflux RND transporter periplasmic adaptor subunit n=1 Tax=Parabacteroides timonensis TaxID=1871013 RepID=UPI00094E1A57|nr:efflux RND transporter periplasmic adaptor subunit [Parabacteroides timonensis]
MKKIKEWIKTKQVQYIIFALAGLLVGWLLFSPSSTPQADSSHHDHSHDSIAGHSHSHDLQQDENGVWTCSMHPQIRQDKPGKCPICGMDLIPVRKSGNNNENIDPSSIQLSEEAMALADVQTSRVSKENPVKQVRLYGKIAPDERSLQSQTAHVGGRIENLAVDFTGETVHSGQTLATLYSPELFTAQQELLEAIKMQQPALIQAAKEKLQLWKMTDAQITAIEQSGTTSPLVEIKSNTSGIVISKKVSQGDYVSQGAILFDVANLSKVWAMFDAYEVDLPFLSKGDPVEFTLQALPGKVYKGKIAFIDPIVNATSRTSRVRVEVSNPQMELKPEMYATATVNAALKGYKDQIVVPQTAVLWTGKRAIVYVKQPDISTPTFQMREVELGPSLGNAYVILKGLSDGEEIVTNGVFSIDASAQLEGKPSMMNNDGNVAQPMTGHAGHAGHSMQASNAQGEHAMFGVKGACDMCKQRIEDTAKSIKGVSSAIWDKNTQTIHLQFDPKQTSVDAIAKAIAAAGHDNDKYKADQNVYDKLPACCHYRK